MNPWELLGWILCFIFGCTAVLAAALVISGIKALVTGDRERHSQNSREVLSWGREELRRL